MDRQSPALLSDLLIGYVLHAIGHLDETRRQDLCQQAPERLLLLGMEGPWEQQAETAFGLSREQLHKCIRDRWQAETDKAPSDPLRFAREFAGDQLIRRWG